MNADDYTQDINDSKRNTDNYINRRLASYPDQYDEFDPYDDPYEDGDDGDDFTPCPKCESDDTYLERYSVAQCFQDIGDPHEQGITIGVSDHYCNDCHHRWTVYDGRPLNVECDCD